ncbi:MAG: hypothetical protein ACUVQT_03780 [bacterium]
MLIHLLLFLSFNSDYQNFIDSPNSESIFVELVRDKSKIIDYKDNPIVLWFWRSKTNDTSVDTFLKNIPMSRNFYLSAVLRWEAKNTNNINEKLEKIRFAVRLDSLSIENFISLISLGLTTRKFDFLKMAFILPVFSDFRNQIFLLGNFALLLVTALLFSGIIFVLIKFIHYLPILSHRFDPLRHNPFKGIIGFALLLLPVLIIRNLYLTFFIYSITLILIFNQREKNWLRINIVLIILLNSIFSMFEFIPFLRGTSNAYHIYQMVAMDSDIRINPETKMEKEILAYVLKRQGRLDEAMALYEDLYYNQHNQNLSILNNLANLYALYEEEDRAEELYSKATRSERGEPYFNLALLKYKKIEYLAAGEKMEEARKRGFISSSKEPVDMPPEIGSFYNLIKTKKFNFSEPVNTFYLLLLMIIFVATFLPFKIQPPYNCAICGKPICKDCAEQTDEEPRCNGCINKLNATKNPEIEEELKYSLGRNQKLFKKILAVVFNIILPGAGLIYKNKNFLGLIIVFWGLMVYIPLFFRSHFIKPACWISLSINPLILVITVVVLFFCYLISFLALGGSDAD